MNAALMHAATKLLQDPPNPELYPTRCNAEYAPVVDKTTDDTPANNSNSERTPTVATRTWNHTAMSSATFALSALLAYVATEVIVKRIRGRN